MTGSRRPRSVLSAPGRMLSSDSSLDEDWFNIPVAPGQLIDLSVSPRGATYAVGNARSGSCSGSTSIETTDARDLALELYTTGSSPDGPAQLVAVADNHGAGQQERLTYRLGDGHYFLRLYGDTLDDVQLYELNLEPNSDIQAALFTSDFESGLSGWTLQTENF